MLVDATGRAVSPADPNHDLPAVGGIGDLVPGSLADDVRVERTDSGKAVLLGERKPGRGGSIGDP